MKIIQGGITLFVGLLFVCSGCSNKAEYQDTIQTEKHFSPDFETTIEYAKRFSIEYHQGYKMVTLIKPWTGAKDNFYYALIDEGMQAPDFPDSILVIHLPVKSIVATSTTHLPAFEYLNSIDHLVGFPNTDFISSSKIRASIDAGNVKELGAEAGMNLETLISVSPDLVMDYAMGNEFDKYKLVKKIGIPVVLNADYMEQSPLGRAEWIKYLGLFLQKEKEADSIFKAIKNKYIALQKLMEPIEAEATVYSGIVYGDIWYMPGGLNFGAKFLNDAKGKYLWSDNESSGFIQLSFEAVYEKAHSADYWIGNGGMTSLAEIQQMDTRYTKFKAFNSGQVYNYNARIGAKGGNEFLELGYLRPDIILADLIKILHPELLPDHQLYFYQKLQ